MSDFTLQGLPSPSDSRKDESGTAQSAGSAGSSHRRVRSVDEILLALDQLFGMVALGLVAPAKANAMRGLAQVMLGALQGTPSGSAGAPIDHALLARLRQDPQLMNMMASLLTPDQIASLMGASDESTAQ